MLSVRERDTTWPPFECIFHYADFLEELGTVCDALLFTYIAEKFLIHFVKNMKRGKRISGKCCRKIKGKEKNKG